MDGVTATAVGYTGGTAPKPTYRQVCSGTTGHAEAVRVEFDPSRVSYERLLEVFFGIHNPTQFGGQGLDRGDQYRSSVFVHSEDQRAAVDRWIARLREEKGRPIATVVTKAGTFWMAEDYHQQYYVKNGVAACPIPGKGGG